MCRRVGQSDGVRRPRERPLRLLLVKYQGLRRLLLRVRQSVWFDCFLGVRDEATGYCDTNIALLLPKKKRCACVREGILLKLPLNYVNC